MGKPKELIFVRDDGTVEWRDIPKNVPNTPKERVGDTVHWHNSRTGVSSESAPEKKTVSGDEIMDMFFTKMADHNRQYKRKLAAMPWWKRMYHKTLNKIDKMIPDED